MTSESTTMIDRALDYLDELESNGADLLGVAQLREELDAIAQRAEALARYPAVLAQVIELTAEGASAARVLRVLADGVGASRGFLGFYTEGSDWQIVASHGGSAVMDEPTEHLSSGLIERARASQSPVVMRDARRELPDQAASVHALRLRSVAVLPLGSPARGFVYLDNPGAPGLFDAGAVQVIRAFLPLLDQLLALSERRGVGGLAGFVTRSGSLRAQLDEVARAATFDLPILLHGETGTGKSHLAELIHSASARRSGPFVHVNCAAIPEALLEAELYGAERGAYTGSVGRKGHFEAAHGGTLFLDELDSMPLHAQAKLLLAVQKRQVVRLGSTSAVNVDVRIVAAMATNPGRAIDDGLLREDLFYRLAVVEVALPPLRERPEDLPAMARAAIARGQRELGLPRCHLTAEALDVLCGYAWPGNVRELQNVLDRAAVLCSDGAIGVQHLRLGRSAVPARKVSKRAPVSEQEFRTAWQQAEGDLDRVAETLNVHRRSIYRLIRRFDGD